MNADLSRVGLAVGHATGERGVTGCTVIRGIDGPMRGAACVFGRATGTRARNEKKEFLDSARLIAEQTATPKFGSMEPHDTPLCVVATNADAK